MSLRLDSRAFIRTDVSLQSFSTFKIGGAARFLAEPTTRDELFQSLEFARSEGLDCVAIGRGSNILFSDDGFNGLLISLRKLEPEWFYREGETRLRVSGGMSLFRLSIVTQELGLSGAEFVCHIPGTVGGALVMNAGFGRKGGLYQEMKGIFESCTLVKRNSRLNVERYGMNDIAFDYRKTDLPSDVIVMEVEIHLDPKPKSKIQEEIKANFAYRNTVQDLRFPSAGSTFKNPKGSTKTSGQLLEAVKMKGFRIGGAMVSERHANFFLNVDHATAHDMLELIGVAQQRVRDQFGIEIEPEIKLVGFRS